MRFGLRRESHGGLDPIFEIVSGLLAKLLKTVLSFFLLIHKLIILEE